MDTYAVIAVKSVGKQIFNLKIYLWAEIRPISTKFDLICTDYSRDLQDFSS